MPTLKEKVFSRITEDFQVLAKIVIRQLNLTKQLMDDNHKEEIYTEINNNERIIDSIEVKIRNEVINMIVLYSPRATNLRMTTNGTAVKAENRQTSQKNILSLALRQPE